MITKELVKQWAGEWYDMSLGAAPCSDAEYIADKASSYGAEQRERELLAVGMEPYGYLKLSKGRFANKVDGAGGIEGIKKAGYLPLYTATQLAAARLQGEQAKAAMQDVKLEEVGYVSEHNCEGPFKLQFHKKVIEIYKDNCTAIHPVCTLESAQQAVVAERKKHCACIFDGDETVEQCKFHNAREEAVHEWAGRSKEAEKRITELEAALRQCLDALEGCLDYGSMTGSEHIEDAAHDALVACEEALK